VTLPDPAGDGRPERVRFEFLRALMIDLFLQRFGEE
jgi:hypothetical protein